MIQAGRVIEPIRDLYKVEVREMAEALGIARAARLAPSVSRARASACGCCARTDACPTGHDPARVQPLIDAQLAGTGLAGRLLPVRSVGVKADLRTYEQPVMLVGHGAARDAAVAIAAQIYGRVPGINRCVLDLSGRADPSRRAARGRRDARPARSAARGRRHRHAGRRSATA